MSRKSQKAAAMTHPHTLIVEWSEEDEAFVGRCPELFDGGVHGTDRVAAYEELCEVVDEHIELSRKDGNPLPEALAGKDFSGKFVLRTTPELHRILALRAVQNGDSLNGYIVKRLSEKI